MLKYLKKHVFLLCAFIVLDILAIYIGLVKTNYEITAPGGITEVNSIIQVENAYSLTGSINSVYVMSEEHTTLFKKWVSQKSVSCEVYDMTPDLDTFDLSNDEQIASGVASRNQSTEASLICAYKEANKINSEISLNYTFKGFIVYYRMLNCELQIGDIIIAVDGISANNDGYIDALRNTYLYDDDDNVIGNQIKDTTYTIYRNGSVFDYTFKNDITKDSKSWFYLYQKYELNLEESSPKCTVGPIYSYGPSAGLLKSLAVYAQLTGIDITHGKKICGTGTISVNGTVGAIGGISQKVVTALRNNVDVFLCPSQNYEEGYNTYISLKGHEKMKFIKVSTFEEAISALGGLE